MTDEERKARVHYHMYETCEGIAEHAERIVRLEEENAKLRALCRDMYLVVELLDMDGMALQDHGKSSDWRTLKERYDELTGVDG